MERSVPWSVPAVMILLGAAACAGGSSPLWSASNSSTGASSTASAAAVTSNPTTVETAAPATQPAPAPTEAPAGTEAPTTAAPETTAPPQTTSPPAPQQVVLTIKDFRFSPDPLRVPAGSVVVVTNRESGDEHTWTSDSGVWDSGELRPGQSFQFTFASSGAFTYRCSFHSSMKGRVEVA